MTQALPKHLCFGAFVIAVVVQSGYSQNPLTWQEVRDRFEKANPSLRAGQIGLDESRAQEITAFLRPNPTFTLLTDGVQAAPFRGVYSPLSGGILQPTFGYLHERQHKRELRLQSAQGATKIAVSGQLDLERTLLFTLRGAFIQTL